MSRSYLDQALSAIRKSGGPAGMTETTYAHLGQTLEHSGASPAQAQHAIAAAVAECFGLAMPEPAHIDVDLCTRFLLAIRTGGRTNFVPLAAIQLIVGAAINDTKTTTPPAPHDNNIH
jgi:hypothetical protein